MTALAIVLALTAGATREVKIPIVAAARVAAAGGAPLIIAPLELAPLHDLDIAGEVARYLESEAGNRTGIEVRRQDAAAPDEAPAAGFRLEGQGRFEEITLASASGAEGGPAVTPGYREAVSRPRWANGYRLRLTLTLRDVATGKVVWQEDFDRDRKPEPGGSALFGLYDLLDPVAEALVRALAGGKESERRLLIVP